jgi:hypothetical protein
MRVLRWLVSPDKKCVWKQYEYTINREILKGTHEIVQANRSPGFLIHCQKSMASNLAIIDIKPFSIVKVFSNLNEDLGKLNFFTGKEALYQHWIMHVYGNDIKKREEGGLIDYFKSRIKNFSNKKKILLSLHTSPVFRPSSITV